MKLYFRRRTSIVMGAACLVWLLLPQSAHAIESFKNIEEAAGDLAPRIAEVIRAEQEKQGKVLEVAVLPFGNTQGKIDEQLFLASKMLQGELATQMRNKSNRQFIVWDPFRTKDQASKTKARIGLMKVDTWKEAADELEKLGLDVVVVGSYQTKDDKRQWEGVNVHTDILFADGPPMQAAGKKKVITEPEALIELGTSPSVSTRFSVDILIDGQPLNMYARKHGFGNNDNDVNYATGDLYLDLDRQQHYGKPFSIRLRNHGMPPVGWIEKTDRLERARFFCAAVFIDGVNSIYEKESDGKFYPSQCHPDKVTKWVLAAPGINVLPGYDSFKNLNAQEWVGGDGQSVVNIKGFQLNGKEAAQFEFADAGESLAHEVGLTKDIGVISVYFYSEKSPGDMRWFPPGIAGAGAGVRPGKTISNEVFRVNVHTYPKPVEMWNIHYRYAGTKGSIDQRRKEGQSIIPVAKAKSDMETRIARQRRQYGGDEFYQRKIVERQMRQFGNPGGAAGSAPR